MADYWDKLEDGKETGRKDAGEVDAQADLVEVLGVVIPFSRCEFGAETVDDEVGEAG